MQWLLTHMWVSLLLAGALGLLAGFGARGFFVSNRVRKAEVDRDVAQTELQQTRAEVDDLYAAQRKQKDAYSAEQGTREHELLQELNSRDSTINNLSSALKEARDELKRFAEEQQAEPQPAEGLAGVVSTAGAAVAGAAIAATATAAAEAAPVDDTKVNELTERNAWLEARIASLEAEISAAAAPIVEPAAEATPVVEAETPVEVPAADLGLEKMRWQNAYLRQRVDALETSLIEQPAVLEDTPDVSSEAEPVLAAVPETVVPEPVEDTSAADEELARLRWRNRYLEGRLAYYEEAQAASAVPTQVEDSTPEIEADDEVSDKVVSLASPVIAERVAEALPEASDEAEELVQDEAEPHKEQVEAVVSEPAVDERDEAEAADAEIVEVEAEPVAVEPSEPEVTSEEVEETEPAPEVIAAEESTPEVEPEVVVEEPVVETLSDEPLIDLQASEPEIIAPVAAEPAEEVSHPSDAVLQELSEAVEPDMGLVQPAAAGKPANGGDDLTAIGGVGPRIASVLNELGIWTYEQIAAWTEENQRWVDDHLAFNGRVSREAWVEQAKSLSAAPETVDA